MATDSRQLHPDSVHQSILYALRVLRCHGIPDQSLKDVFQVTVLAKITYCFQRGLVSAEKLIVQDSTPF